MSRMEKRVTRVETLTGLQALDAYRNLPLQQWPDWALASESSAVVSLQPRRDC